jgi:Cu-processing system ATP-binding protein
MSAPNVIEAVSLTKRYDAATVLDAVTAAVPHGEVVGLLGHNGAGKTTLIKLALGLIRPTAGELRVFGIRVEGADPCVLHRRMGYLPENVAFYENLTGREVIAYLARLKGAPEREAAALLRQVGLEGAAAKRVRTYSKGMRQRLGVAQALLGSPELLFLDEPTTGLDPVATQEFFQLVSELKAAGRTIVISSHLLAELEAHIDRAVILRQGRLVAQGTLSEMQRAAGLAVDIRARVSGKLNGLLGEPWVKALSRPPRVTDGGCFSLEVPPARKVEVLRRLLDVPALSDVSVREPTLARLYAAIGERSIGGETGDA